jgi:hypothetical protein
LKKVLFLAILTIVLTAILGVFTNVFAASEPSFFSCSNPLGTILVSYDSGNHGVPGDANLHQGKDTVYSGPASNATQCLCETSGQGIQTNWWKVDGITQEEINQQLKNGWNYIPDGSAWGLENSVYLAKNSYYICGPLGRGGGEVLGTGGGEVLGLASTGDHNVKFLSLFFGLSIISLGLYFFDENRI